MLSAACTSASTARNAARPFRLFGRAAFADELTSKAPRSAAAWSAARFRISSAAARGAPACAMLSAAASPAATKSSGVGAGSRDEVTCSKPATRNFHLHAPGCTSGAFGQAWFRVFPGGCTSWRLVAFLLAVATNPKARGSNPLGRAKTRGSTLIYRVEPFSVSEFCGKNRSPRATGSRTRRTPRDFWDAERPARGIARRELLAASPQQAGGASPRLDASLRVQCAFASGVAASAKAPRLPVSVQNFGRDVISVPSSPKPWMVRGLTLRTQANAACETRSQDRHASPHASPGRWTGEG